jgi:DNA-binding IclR family transcriptional regulator
VLTENKGVTRTIDRAFCILDCFLEEESLTLNEIAEKVSLSTSTVYRLLSTMTLNEYLVKNRAKKYSLGPKIVMLGSKCSVVKYEKLIDTVKPFMEQLNRKHDESISLYVIEGEQILCIERIETTRVLKQASKKGDYLELTSGSSGKLLLAFSNKSLQKKVIGDNPFLWSAIEKIYEDEIAISSGEKSEGITCIATPIRNSQNNVVAALTMTGLFTRFIGKDLEEKILDTVLMSNKATKAFVDL